MDMMRTRSKQLLGMLLSCTGLAAAQPPFAADLHVDVSAMRATNRGTLVRDVVVGQGTTVGTGTVVALRYMGWLADGTPVDSTAAGDRPLTFVVGQHAVIGGWEDGVVGMKVGGQRQLVVPPKRAYGGKGAGPIPPNATLVFTITLVGARPATEAELRRP